jgi:hypothetical protein
MKPHVFGRLYRRIIGSGNSENDNSEISHEVTVKLGPRIEIIAPPPMPATITSVRTLSVLTRRNGATIATNAAPITTKFPVAASMPQSVAARHVKAPKPPKLLAGPKRILSQLKLDMREFIDLMAALYRNAGVSLDYSRFLMRHSYHELSRSRPQCGQVIAPQSLALFLRFPGLGRLFRQT